MDAIDVITKFQGYLTERVKYYSSESKNLSNLTQEELWKRSGEIEALFDVQKYVLSIVQMIELE